MLTLDGDSNSIQLKHKLKAYSGFQIFRTNINSKYTFWSDLP